MQLNLFFVFLLFAKRVGRRNQRRSLGRIQSKTRGTYSSITETVVAVDAFVVRIALMMMLSSVVIVTFILVVFYARYLFYVVSLLGIPNKFGNTRSSIQDNRKRSRRRRHQFFGIEVHVTLWAVYVVLVGQIEIM
jgi:hypothetical protein